MLVSCGAIVRRSVKELGRPNAVTKHRYQLETKGVQPSSDATVGSLLGVNKVTGYGYF